MNKDAAARDAQIRAVLGEHRRRRDSGEQISDVALIAAHPELMPELGEELRKLRLIAAAREQAAQPIVAEVATRSHHGSDTGSGSGRLEVRCPSCHQPTEVLVDTTLTDLTCSSCGSHFSLVDQSKATRMAPSLSKMGRFELIERLGVGGFGSVWKARDKELDRTVAIKIPRAGGMTGEEQEKFFREARAAAQLKHPNIVSVHEVGRDGDSVFIVSDFVRGVTLGDWLTGQQLTSREAAELCAKLAEALHHAHEKGVVHRDLKPANIMIDGDGLPHIMDFGLARRDVGEVTVTMDGQILGTPAYMSPEQAQGKAHTADRRSDVYSLGVILFQLLTGELPFRGNARMLIHQTTNDPAPSPRKLNSNVPKDLETITLKCLEKEPAKRYQTANEIGDECRRFLSGNVIHARPTGRLARAWRWCKRRPAAAALMALVGGVAIAAPLVAGRQAALRHRSDLVAQQLDDRNAALQDQLTRNTFDRACAEYAGGRVSEGISLLVGTYRRARPDSPLKVSCRNLMSGWAASVGRLLLHQSSVQTVAFSPDGRFAITGSDDETAQVWNCQTGRPVGKPLKLGCSVWAVSVDGAGHRLLTAGGRWGQLWNFQTLDPIGPPLNPSEQYGQWPESGYYLMDGAISPDGKTVLFGSTEPDELRLWDVKTRKAFGASMRHENTTCCVAFSPDGALVLTGSYDKTARFWDSKTGVQQGAPLEHPGSVTAVTFGPDGRTAFTASGRMVRKWDIKSTNLVGQLLECDADINALAVSSDGRIVLTGGEDRIGQLWDLESAKRRDRSLQHSGSVISAAFSSDGHHFLTGSYDSTARLWDLNAGRPTKQFKLHDRSINSLAFSVDGRYLLTASSDSTARIWRAESGEPVGQPMHHKDIITVATFSPDGRTVLTGSTDKTTRLWDSESGEPLDAPWEHGTRIHAAAFAADGNTVFIGGSRYARFWDVKSGRPMEDPVLRTADVHGVAISSDGRCALAACSDGRVRTWQAKSHTLLNEFRMHAVWARAAAISSDNLTALTGASDTTAYLWNLETGMKIGQPLRHCGRVTSVAFSPNGYVAVTASTDRTARYWDTATGQPLGQSLQHEANVTAATFRPDGEFMVTGSADGLVRYWKVPHALQDDPDLIDVWARVRTGLETNDHGEIRRLTQDEWNQAQEKLESLRSGAKLP